MKAHLSKRITSWVICFILFVISSAILIFYAAGFNYDFKNHKIVRTGMIYLTTDPNNNLEVSVDGRVLSTKSPAKLSYLRPGNHLVEIKKPGYVSWKNNYKVFEDTVIYQYNITLFLKNFETSKIDSKVNEFLLSPDKKNLIFTKKTGLYLANSVDNFNSAKQLNKNQDINKLIWSDRSDKFCYEINSNIYIYDLSQQKSIKIPNAKKYSKIKLLRNYALLLSENSLYKFEYETQKTSFIVAPIYDFEKISDTEFVASYYDSQNKYSLIRYNFTQNKIRKLVPQDSKIIKISKQGVTILFTNQRKQLFELTSNINLNIIHIANNVEKYTSSKYNRLFLSGRGKTGVYYFNNKNEIYFYSKDEKIHYFITKTSSQIDCLEPYLHGDLIAYCLNNELIVSDGTGINKVILGDVLKENFTFLDEDSSKLIILSPAKELKILKIR